MGVPLQVEDKTTVALVRLLLSGSQSLRSATKYDETVISTRLPDGTALKAYATQKPLSCTLNATTEVVTLIHTM